MSPDPPALEPEVRAGIGSRKSANPSVQGRSRMGGPADHPVLWAAAQVEWQTAEGTLGNIAGGDPRPVFQPERSRQRGELAIERVGFFPGIDRAGGLTHDRAAIEISGVPQQGGSSLSQAVDDGPVDRSRPGE